MSSFSIIELTSAGNGGKKLLVDPIGHDASKRVRLTLIEPYCALTGLVVLFGHEPS
jgi:hypothetical protein